MPAKLEEYVINITLKHRFFLNYKYLVICLWRYSDTNDAGNYSFLIQKPG